MESAKEGGGRLGIGGGGKAESEGLEREGEARGGKAESLVEEEDVLVNLAFVQEHPGAGVGDEDGRGDEAPVPRIPARR